MPRSSRTPGGRHSEPNREYDTQSLTASVTEYPIENGRTYHRYHEGSYVYPNDEREMDRLDMQHHMCKLLTGGRLFFAPIIHPRKILDIGTGSGIWPIELASIFPHAQITGTDLSPCQPTEVPENVHFIVDDITEDEWLWEPNSLDYIHTGHLSGALPSYKDVLRKMYKHLKPGAWAEIHEFDTLVKCDDDTMPPLDESQFSTYPFQDWCDLQIQSGHATDPPRQFRVAQRLARGMKDLGFVDVEERIFKAPVNPWSSDPHLRTIGQWNETNILEALSGWSYKPLATLGWSKPEIEVFLVNVRRSVKDRRVHAYFNFHVITGRKPHAGEQ
ncbi:S-adenosyl-L-methionine-dependent methyltransferase [Aspergillus crustosus]